MFKIYKMFSKNRKNSIDPKNISRPKNPMSKSFEDLTNPDIRSSQPDGPSFYFGTGFNGTSKIVESDDSNKSLNYIILQNDEFHQKHEEFLKEITDLKSENEILEEDNGRMETDKTRLKGLAINEAEKSAKYKKAILLYGSEIQEKYKTNKKLSHVILKIILSILVVQIVYVSVSSFVLSRTNHLSYALLPVSFVLLMDGILILAAELFIKPIYKNSSPFRDLQFWSFWNPDSMNGKHVSLNKILKEISEIEKGSSYLEQLIDN